VEEIKGEEINEMLKNMLTLGQKELSKAEHARLKAGDAK